jgi:UDP-GlcNAc:undecaprenyl-phosphate GlcNAc-1-phosphate transferase
MVWVYIVVLILVLAWLWLRWFARLGILDKPWADIVPARKPVPTMQGLILYVVFLLIVSLFFPQWWDFALFQWLFAWITIILAVTTVDEYFYIRGKQDLPAWIRLLAQIVAAVVAIYIGGIAMDERVFQGVVVSVPFVVFAGFFVLWSLLCINAINRFDGVYGQASGVSSIGFLTIVLLIHFVVLPYYSSISSANADILLWVSDISLLFFVLSLVYTIVEYKPYGLLRDLGTMVFGFTLAYISIVGWAKIGTLVVALSLVIFDAIWVGIHRIFFLRKNPLKGDYTHLHYRLLWLGWTKGEVRFFVRGWSLVMMVLMLLQWADRWWKIVIFVVMALVFFWVNGYLFWVKKLPCGLKVIKK